MSRGLVQGVPLASPFQRSGSSKNYGRVTSMNVPGSGGNVGQGQGAGVGGGVVAGGVPPGLLAQPRALRQGLQGPPAL